MSTPPPKNEKPDHFLLRFGVLGGFILRCIHGERWWLAPIILLICVLSLSILILHTFSISTPFMYVAF